MLTTDRGKLRFVATLELLRDYHGLNLLDEVFTS